MVKNIMFFIMAICLVSWSPLLTTSASADNNRPSTSDSARDSIDHAEIQRDEERPDSDPKPKPKTVTKVADDTDKDSMEEAIGGATGKAVASCLKEFRRSEREDVTFACETTDTEERRGPFGRSYWAEVECVCTLGGGGDPASTHDGGFEEFLSSLSDEDIQNLLNDY